ncbi:MAG: caspase family protein [Myxococcota bacterium]
MSAFALTALLCVAATPPAGSETTKTYAVIVASNTAPDSSLTPLRYADDDGARFYELFATVSDDVQLLTVLDADSQKTYPNLANATQPPTKKALRATLANTYQKISQDTAKGIRTVLYFIYVGHGSVDDDGEGVMHFLDGKFSRSDLFHDVIEKSPASVNHVVIDACNAYLMVARRGGEEEKIKAAVAQFLDRESLARYPNTGVLLSTSQATEVHEWARFEAGIFSHEVRSGAIGAADVDGDGNVSYDEIRAFISAANARVSDPKAKLQAFAVAPALNRAEPFFRLREAPRGVRLKVPSTLEGRWFLQDARGVRYADFNAGAPITLLLTPSELYFLRSEGSELKIPTTGMVEVDAANLERTPIALASRGAEVITFQRDLFAVPFGAGYFEGFRDALPMGERVDFVREHPVPVRTVVGMSLGGAGLGILATGLGFGLAASAAAKDARTHIGSSEEVAALSSTSSTFATTSNVMYAVGGGLLATGIGLWLWPTGD